MNTMQRMLLATTVAVGAWGAAGVAQARGDVYWSVGVGGPGLSVGVGSAQPVYVAPQPVYVAPPPVYVRPRPVYAPPPAYYYGPPRVAYQPAPVYYGPPGHYKRPKKHRRHYQRGWDY